MKRLSIAATIVVCLICNPLMPLAGASSSHDPSADLAKAQAKANDASKRFSDSVSALSQAQDQIDSLNAQLNRNKDRVSQLSNRVRDMAIADFVGASDTDSFFDISGDINDDARRHVVLAGVAQDSQDTMDEFLSARDNLSRSQKELESELATQQKAADDLKKNQQDAEAEVNNLSKQAAAFKAQQAAAAKSPASKKSVPQSGPPVNIGGSGDWLCPVAGPHAFSDDFGAPRSGGRTHQGNDILSPRNTPVIANVDGVVKFHPNALGGNAYYLEGTDGNEYYGAHLDHYGASGNVSKGTVIGYVGNTGDAAGGPTHLHFEIHPHGGAAIDPYTTLRKYC